MRLKLEQCNESAAIEEINRLLRLSDLASIIRAWVSDTRSLAVVGGSDDDTKEPRVYLLFEDKLCSYEDGLVAFAFCNKGEILAEIPDVQKVIPPPFTRKAFDFESVSETDKKFFQKRREFLKFEWNDFLQADVGSVDSAAIKAMGLALSDYGETTFSKAKLDWIDEEDDEDEFDEDPEIYRQHFLWAHSLRGKDKGSMFECSDYYLDLRKLQDSSIT